jgi:hypothetical protein
MRSQRHTAVVTLAAVLLAGGGGGVIALYGISRSDDEPMSWASGWALGCIAVVVTGALVAWLIVRADQPERAADADKEAMAKDLVHLAQLRQGAVAIQGRKIGTNERDRSPQTRTRKGGCARRSTGSK